jgi:biopolymer transport protein ExbD
MAAVKPKRHGPAMDMTAMCDVAFLLLTFFIMASSFKSEETVTVQEPSSRSEALIPETNACMITVDPQGRYYFGIVDPSQRDDFAVALNEDYNLNLTKEEIIKFTTISEFGVPMKQIKPYLNLSEGQRASYDLKGIPLDSVNTELTDWVKLFDKKWPGGAIAVKGDGSTKYPSLKNLFDRFAEENINKFQLITKIEKK